LINDYVYNMDNDTKTIIVHRNPMDIAAGAEGNNPQNMNMEEIRGEGDENTSANGDTEKGEEGMCAYLYIHTYVHTYTLT
jgi:hypothetical protein